MKREGVFRTGLLLLFVAFIFTDCQTRQKEKNEPASAEEAASSTEETAAHNTLSAQEKQEGWKLLFDGKTTDGWRNFKSQEIGAAWKVEDGTLTLEVSDKEGWQAKNGGDIITDQAYENFELALEWKISEGGNSGIIYHVLEEDQYEYVWHTGPEMQILDDAKHPDGKIEKHRAGDLYDLIECTSVTVNPPNQWNQVRLISNNGQVEHWLNGQKVVAYDMNDHSWKALVEGSKFKEMPDFGSSKKGYIALQDHGDRVWFRNIKIRSL
ncbi:DUF1080 domain-containing protein [Fulvivirgaceae bacterium BMA12]|uniref:DUF1080 domain-containing protein n=1 Tax=Agaribacillus aureus TaxID=3051825 RepID=A0ABT8LHP5_9BACT|nr:DUF1080 domain-containing protein [Fulvivirgaceae bacterium BMA12]